MPALPIPVSEMDSESTTALTSDAETSVSDLILDHAYLHRCMGNEEVFDDIKRMAKNIMKVESSLRRIRLGFKKFVEHLITGPAERFYSLEDAKQASLACKWLFFAPAQDGDAGLFAPDYLLALGRQLRLMEPLPITPKQYKLFIILFCYSASADKLRLEEKGVAQECILKTCVRVKSLVGLENCAPQSNSRHIADLIAAVAEMKKGDMSQGEDVETAKNILQEAGLKGSESSDELDIHEAIQNAAQAGDPDKIKKSLGVVVNSLHVTIMEKLRREIIRFDKLREELDQSKELDQSILDERTQRNTQAEDGADIPAKNGEDKRD